MTTTINLFLNFIEPTSGAARIKGLDVTKEPLETKRYIAYIPEQAPLYKNLSGLENLEYFSALAGHEEYSREQLLKFFEDVGLQREAADRRVSTYSKGMRQQGRDRDRAGEDGRSASARRADLGTRPESVERVFGTAEKAERPGCGGANGDARSIPRERVRHASRDYETRETRRAVEH
jgi:hypothetical protein